MPNRTYLFLQRSQTGRTPPSPAQMQEMFAKFTAWREKFKDNILDIGGRLMPNGKVVTSSGATDGPFIETKEIVGGYMLVSAADLDEAVQVATEGMAMMLPGASLEIREISRP